MDDEEEMAKMRNNRLFQNKIQWDDKNAQPPSQDSDNESDEQQDPKEDKLLAAKRENMNRTGFVKDTKKREVKRKEKQSFRKVGDSESSDDDDGLQEIQARIPDTELIKMQRYVDHNEGIAFMDDDNHMEKPEPVEVLTTQQKRQKLREKLLNTNASDVLDPIIEDIIPEKFGKTKNSLKQKEKIKLFSRVKRENVEVESKNLIKRHDIDMDEDEDLVGPPIPMEILFAKNEEEPHEKAHTDPVETKEPQKAEAVVEESGELNEAKRSTNSEDEFDEIDRILLENNIPISHETICAGHSKGILALDIDPAGIRMVTGGLDEKVKLWDFQGMNRSMISFKEFTPHDGYPVLCLNYSLSGNQILVITGSWHAKIYSRDGKQQKETIRGDMYIRDTFNTKGHVSSLTDGMWHPTLRNKFLTSSIDGTIRLWDVESKLVGVDQQLMQEKVTKALHYQTSRPVKVFCCKFSVDGSAKAAGCEDGTIKFWDEKGPNYRPTNIFQDAHSANAEITSVVFYKDGHRMLSRAMDDTLKFWDWRFPSEPINVWTDLMNFTTNTNVALSPDEKIILTGDSVKRGMGNGCMHFFSTDTFEKLCQIGVSEGNVVRSIWHPKINQIITSSTDSNAHIYFDPDMSSKGALNCIVKEPRKHQPDDMQYGNPILAPHALPQFKQTYMSATKKLKLEEEEKKEKSVKRYVLGSSSTYQQYIMKMINKNTQREEDPREALLKFNDEAKSDAMWINSAYMKTQPKAVFNYDSIQRDVHKLVEETEAKICPK
mmetsp:Transcript_32825/g.37567  ORF Transcript_32825/g.37567 Transcript_32825/m.37567 type:complete len:771 (+) Transcript_32825:86-2398(+)